MSPNGGASQDQPGEPGKRCLSVKAQPGRMVIVRSISLEIRPEWRLMFIEYVEDQAPQGLVNEITVGTGYAYVIFNGYGEQAEKNRGGLMKLIDDVVALITPATVVSWVERRNAEAVPA